MAVSRYSEESPPPELLREIRERLASVCAEWPPELFDAVTARAAWIEFKYDRAMTDNFRTIPARALANIGLREASGTRDSSPGR